MEQKEIIISTYAILQQSDCNPFYSGTNYDFPNTNACVIQETSVFPDKNDIKKSNLIVECYTPNKNGKNIKSHIDYRNNIIQVLKDSYDDSEIYNLSNVRRSRYHFNMSTSPDITSDGLYWVSVLDFNVLDIYK